MEVVDGGAVVLEHGETWMVGDEFGYGRWWLWLRKCRTRKS